MHPLHDIDTLFNKKKRSAPDILFAPPVGYSDLHRCHNDRYFPPPVTLDSIDLSLPKPGEPGYQSAKPGLCTSGTRISGVGGQFSSYDGLWRANCTAARRAA